MLQHIEKMTCLNRHDYVFKANAAFASEQPVLGFTPPIGLHPAILIQCVPFVIRAPNASR